MKSIYFYQLVMYSYVTTMAFQLSSFPGNTADLEKMKKLAAIKVRILSKIGLNDRPFVGKPVANHRITGKLLGGRIKNVKDEVNKPRGEYYAEIQEVVSHSQIPENVTNSNVIQFKVVRDNQGRKLEVTSADLLVKVRYKRNKRRVNRRHRKMKLKEVSLKLSSVDLEGNPENVVASLTTRIRKTKWLKIPVPASLIENAIQRKDQNFYLHLKCEGCDRAAKLILINGKRNRKRRKRRLKRKKGETRDLKPRRKRRRLNRTRPFLILHTKVKTYIRSKRNAIVCTNNSTCCMENLHVDFSSLGWADWILAPASFDTGVCSGACANNNTSCRETKSTHLKIVFVDQNGIIIFTLLPNMIVTECGCSSDKLFHM